MKITTSKGDFSGNTLEEIVGREFGRDAEVTRHPLDDKAYQITRYVGGERPYLVIGEVFSVSE